jgi:ribosomal protein S11
MNDFKNSKSKAKIATQSTAEKMSYKAKLLKCKKVIFIIKGKNKGRKKCFKFLRKKIRIRKIIDKTFIIHNGCRPQKKPRL